MSGSNDDELEKVLSQFVLRTNVLEAGLYLALLGSPILVAVVVFLVQSTAILVLVPLWGLSFVFMLFPVYHVRTEVLLFSEKSIEDVRADFREVSNPATIIPFVLYQEIERRRASDEEDEETDTPDDEEVLPLTFSAQPLVIYNLLIGDSDEYRLAKSERSDENFVFYIDRDDSRLWTVRAQFTPEVYGTRVQLTSSYFWCNIPDLIALKVQNRCEAEIFKQFGYQKVNRTGSTSLNLNAGDRF